MQPIPIRKVCLIQPAHPLPNMVMRSVVIMPRYGTPLIATILRQHGYETTLFCEEIYPINWDMVLEADVIGLHVLVCSTGAAQRIAEKIRFLRPNVPIIVGGTHPTYMPESCLRFADYVVRQEGEETMLDLLDALKTGRDPETVPGLTFYKNGKRVQTPDRPPAKEFNTVVDLSTIYRWEDAYKHDRRYPLMTIQATRGCPFRCKFCVVATMFSPGYRKRDVDSVVADIKDKVQYSKYVLFVDNNFAADHKYTSQILQRIIDEKIRAEFKVFCRSDIRKRPELIRLMKKAGVSTIFMGIESLNPETLRDLNKRHEVRDVEEAIRLVHKNGIHVQASLMFGLDTDTKESVRETVQLLMNWDIGQVCIFAFWGIFPEQGEPPIPANRWIFKDWAYGNGNFVTHFPLRMKPSTLQREIMNAYEKILKRRWALLDLLKGRYKKAIWRMLFRTAWRSTKPFVLGYIPYLEETEKGYYDENENLQIDRLDARPDLPWVLHNLQ